MDKTISESSERTKHVSRPFSPSENAISVTETMKTEKKISVRMERSHSPKEKWHTPFIERKLAEPVEEDKEPLKPEKLEEVAPIQLPHEESNEDIDRSSITKRSALDFFKTKMKESEELQKIPEPQKPKPLLHSISTEETEIPPTNEVFSKQSEIVSQLKTVHLQQESAEEKKVGKSKPAYIDAISLAKESYSIVKEEKSSFNKIEIEEKITEPLIKAIKLQPRKEILSPEIFENGFNLTPEPPPEIGFIPKPEKASQIRQDISEKVKKLEEFHKVSSPVDIPSGGVRLFPIVFPKPETQPETPKPEVKETKKETERVIETLPPLSWLIDEPVKKEEKIETFSSKQEVREEIIQKKVQAPAPIWTSRTFSPPPVAYSATPPPKPAEKVQFIQKETRPFSPRPSAQGLAMEKLWASKKSEEETKTVIIESPKPAFQPSAAVFRPSSSLEPLRPASPRPSAEGVAMEKLWASQKAFEHVRPATSLGITNRCASPKPSQEGLAMDKIWAHKHKESNLKVNWPPPQPKEEKPSIPWVNVQVEPKCWPPQENAGESAQTTFIETRTMQESSISRSERQEFSYSVPPVVEPKIPVQQQPSVQQPPVQQAPVQHYIAESRLIRQTRSMDRQDVFVKESKTSTSEITKSDVYIEDSLFKPSLAKKLWPPSTPDLQAPTLVKQATVERTVSNSETKEPQLRPGPPPEIGFAAPPERRTSLVEIIEQDLKKEIFKPPSKQLPGAVRIIPPPTKKESSKPTKKEMKRSSSLESRPFEKFPDLEPFPFKPDPPKPKPAKCPPPPTPTKFIKGRFADSDYESDYDSRISVKWRPYESDGEEIKFRRVRPPSTTNRPKRPQSTEPEPLPPSKFEKPPEFDGPPRPVVQTEALKQTKISSQTKKEILRHFSEPIKKQEKKKLAKKAGSPPKMKPGSPPEYLKVKPDSPKTKQSKQIKLPESGYMADTDEPFIFREKQKSEKSVYKESSTKIKTSQSLEKKTSFTKVRFPMCENFFGVPFFL